VRHGPVPRLVPGHFRYVPADSFLLLFCGLFLICRDAYCERRASLQRYSLQLPRLLPACLRLTLDA
jgi:hypothetical protein